MHFTLTLSFYRSPSGIVIMIKKVLCPCCPLSQESQCPIFKRPMAFHSLGLLRMTPPQRGLPPTLAWPLFTSFLP